MGEVKHSMKIALITPAGARSRTGNRHTATRWAAMLRSLGHRVRVSVRWDGRAADVMIALHARRSHASIARFRERFPASPLVVVLTGTDLYRDIRTDKNAKASLALADRLVVPASRAHRAALSLARELTALGCDALARAQPRAGAQLAHGRRRQRHLRSGRSGRSGDRIPGLRERRHAGPRLPRLLPARRRA